MRMNKKGFTLVELMVVLAILGLLAGIGVPQYTKVLQRAKVGADIARVAQIQSAVNAFLAECGSAGAVDEIAAMAAAKDYAAFTDLTGDSIITGAEIQLVRDFLDTGMSLTLPGAMESTKGRSATAWFITRTGKVSIGTADTSEATADVLK